MPFNVDLLLVQRRLHGKKHEIETNAINLLTDDD